MGARSRYASCAAVGASHDDCSENSGYVIVSVMIDTDAR
jgi:hypothetical protein